MALLTARDLELSHGGPNLLDRISLTVEPGDRLCIVGRNGSGKSTLLNVLAGRETIDAGTIGRDRDTTIALLPQEAPTNLAGSAVDVALVFASPVSAPPDGERVAPSPVAIPPITGSMPGTTAVPEAQEERRVRVEQHLTRLGVPLDAPVDTMSGGEMRRTLLAGVLAAEAEVLLLDEPTNHLDIAGIVQLEDHLLDRRRRSRGVLFVTHDRVFARRVATRVVEIDRGSLVSFSGGYDTFVQRREEQLRAEEREQVEFEKRLAMEEAWLRKGTRARRTRDEGRVKALLEMRRLYAERRARAGSAALSIAEAGRPGDIIVECESVSLTWPGSTRPVIRNLTTSISRGDRIGIIGPNGAGKTTLLRFLVSPWTESDGTNAPEVDGTVRYGTNIDALYFDQLREELDPDSTIFDALGDGYDTITVQGRRKNVAAYMKEFLFSPDDVNRPVRTLSGGEKNRLLLARRLARPANVIVMDEPTNDLDAETLELLEDRLSTFSGTVLLVSHDRAFLDNIVVACLVIGPDGTVEESPGGYSDRERRRADAADEPSAGSATDPSRGLPAHTATTDRKKPVNRERKLGFREQREREELPDRIAALETEVSRIHALLADPDVYRGTTDDTPSPSELTARLEEIEGEITEAMDRWEELEEIALRE